MMNFEITEHLGTVDDDLKYFFIFLVSFAKFNNNYVYISFIMYIYFFKDLFI